MTATVGTLTRHSWPQALQRYFVSVAPGSPFSGSAGIFFLLRNVYSVLPHCGQVLVGVSASIQLGLAPRCQRLFYGRVNPTAAW